MRNISRSLPPRPLPVVLPPLEDELLSSWFNRHANFYGVGWKCLLRYCSVAASSLRDLDLKLTFHDQQLLAHLLRCDPWSIRNMMQSFGRDHRGGLIATVQPMQVCSRCVSRHHSSPVTRGARLRSWMEGWRLDCPVCGTALEDARPFDRLTGVDPDTPLLVRQAQQARQGELMVTRAARSGQPDEPVVALMRGLLLPRVFDRYASSEREIPRLLDVVIPGFDHFLHQWYPGFQRPGTLLLPLSIRVPVLAGVARVANQADYWVESLASAVADTARPALVATLSALAAARKSTPAPGSRASRISHLLPQ